LEKLFLAGRQIRAKAEARPASLRREIVSDGIKAARSRENLVDDFIPSRYLVVSCQDRRHYWNDDENIGGKKASIRKIFFCVLSPRLNLFVFL